MDLRKVIVGLLAVGTVMTGFLVYTRYAQTPALEISREPNLAGPGPDWMDSEHAGGQIGGWDVNRVDRPVWTQRDDQGRILRQWGWDRAWNRGQDDWEASNPFFCQVLRGGMCKVTADRGLIRLEGGSRAYPRQGTFTGHVRAEVIPDANSTWVPLVLDLNDISFVTDRSMFTSLGPVQVASDLVTVVGRGLEGVYDDRTNRLQYLVFFQVDRVRAKVPKQSPLVKRIAQSDPCGAAEDGLPSSAQAGSLYRCVLKDHVVIGAAPVTVVARSAIEIRDILPSPGRGLGPAGDVSPADSALPARAGPPVADVAPLEVTLACRGPVILARQDVQVTRVTDLVDACSVGGDWTEPPAGPDGSRLFVAQDIQYSLAGKAAQARGPLELSSSYVPRVSKGQTPRMPLPMRVTARDRGAYDPNTHQIRLEGQCLCSVVRPDPNATDQFSIQAPILEIDLLGDKDPLALAGGTDVRHLAGLGGQVTLRWVTLAPRAQTGAGWGMDASTEVLQRGAQMECSRCDYDPNAGAFLATGPGTLFFNNGKGGNSPQVQGRPCYAVVTGFQTLTYDVAGRQVGVRAGGEPMAFHYFPDGRVDRHVVAQASVVTLTLGQSADGQVEVESVVAAGDITYKDETGHECTGRRLAYAQTSGELELTGDSGRPCTVDAVAVSGLRANLKTGEFKVEVIEPGGI